ncbi:MAG TPA: type II toxin-antitoxin system RelE/ParE family toxin [Opitutaceae bacterium]|nr:type II toxin-antitoxin system RelE/ParE family toxin [Opitutaceae bacterium]
MDYRLIYTKLAERDLEEIVRYIARDNVRAAGKIGLRLIEVAETLARFPYQGVPLCNREGVRKILCAPYIIFYRVDETQRTIRVQRFWHAKRDRKAMEEQ